MSLEIVIEMLAATLRETNLKLDEIIDKKLFPVQGPKVDITPVQAPIKGGRTAKVTPPPATVMVNPTPDPKATLANEWGDFDEFASIAEAPKVAEPPMEEKTFLEEANKVGREIAIKTAKSKGITPQEALQLVYAKVLEACGQDRLAAVLPENRRAVINNISKIVV